MLGDGRWLYSPEEILEMQKLNNSNTITVNTLIEDLKTEQVIKDVTQEFNNLKHSTNPKDLLGIKKPSLSLIPSTALVKESEAFKDGALKYGAFNWRDKKIKATVYIDAVYRHLLAYAEGEDVTRDTGVDHRAAIRASMAILIDAEEHGCLIDDRQKSTKTGDLIERYTKS